MRPWLDAVARLPDSLRGFTRVAALTLLGVQAVLCVIGALDLVMLHGDGAFFVYAIGTGEPWSLKWSAIAPRAAVYVLSVVPTQIIAEIFRLAGRQTAIVNGFIFNAIPVIQFATAIALAGRRYCALLIFPVAQYAFATGLGFGFASEMLLAPGFFWICMFLLLQRPVPVAPFALSYAGLVFSHELAIPGALLIAWFAWAQAKDEDTSLQHTTRRILAVCGTLIAAWLAVRVLAGGAGSDENAKYVFDPRRLFNDPTLWLIVLSALMVAAWSWRTKAAASSRSLLLVAGASALAIVALQQWLNFASGRYDSARTLMGAAMLVFGAGFVLSRLRKQSTPVGAPDAFLVSAVPLALTAALAINVAASAVFLANWRTARAGFEELAARATAESAFNYVTFEQARSMMSAEQVRANERLGFAWSWPYRSLALADNYTPRYVIYHPHDIAGICGPQRVSSRRGTLIPEKSIQSLEAFSCAQPSIPPHFGLYARFMQWLKTLLGLGAPTS